MVRLSIHIEAGLFIYLCLFKTHLMARRRRVIFHIDVNSAFLSWTAVQLMQSGHQDIRLVPSVVSGDPSDRRSIITAASIPAKKIGIKTAEPVTMALRKCPNLVVVKGDWEYPSSPMRAPCRCRSSKTRRWTSTGSGT